MKTGETCDFSAAETLSVTINRRIKIPHARKPIDNLREGSLLFGAIHAIGVISSLESQGENTESSGKMVILNAALFDVRLHDRKITEAIT